MPNRRRVVVLLLVIALASCRSNPHEKYARFVESGKAKLQARDYARAILELRNAIQLDPEQAEAHYQIALAYLATNRIDEGVFELRTAIRIAPSHVSAQVKLAEAMVLSRESKWVEDAESRLEKIIVANPQDADALFVLAAAQTQLGKSQEAEKYLKEILRRSPQELRASLALAQVRAAQGDWKGAEGALRSALDQAPNSPDAIAAMAGLLLVADRKTEAESLYRKAIQIDPNHAHSLLRLAEMKALPGNNPTEAEQLYRRISNLPSGEWKAIYGEFLIRQGRVDDAISEFRRLAVAAPQDRLARSRLVAALISANRLKEAELVLDKALAANSRDADALLQRSQVHVASGDIAQAETDLDKVRTLLPDSPVVHFLIAQINGAHGRERIRLQELEEAVRLAPAWLVARVEYANALVQAHSAQAALVVLAAAPEPHKNTLAWLVAQNWAHIGVGDFAKARDGIRRGIQSARTADLLLQDGLVKMAAQDHAGARAVLEELLEKNPGDSRALAALSRSYQMRNESAAGITVIRGHAVKNPNSYPVQMFYARSLMEAGHPEQAKSVLTALQPGPSDAGPSLLLAKIAFEQGNLPEAQIAIQSALAADPGSLAGRLMQAMLDEASSRPAEAATQYRKVMDENPEDLVALNNLACLLARDPAQLDVALSLAQKAKQLAPDSMTVQDTLGWIYYRKGHYTLAERELKEAFHPKSPAVVRYHFGLTLLKTGRQAEGTRLIAEALRADPSLAKAEIR